MYQLLICSVLYSIVAEKKSVDWIGEFFIVILPSANEDTRQKDVNAECQLSATRQRKVCRVSPI